MYNVLTCITEEHELRHVLAAFFVLLFSTCCSIIMFYRSQNATQTGVKLAWGISAGLVVGLGIWATHFIALLGYQPGFSVVFDGWRTVLSILIVVSGFIFNKLILKLNSAEPVRLLCALVATACVASMHFYGTSALHASAVIEYDPTTITMALILGFLFFAGKYLFGANPNIRLSTIWSTAVGVLAVLSIHFISASGTTMIPIRGLSEPVWVLETRGLGVVIAIVMGVILGLSAMLAVIDTRFHKMRRQERRKLSVLADASSEGLFVVSREGTVLHTNLSAKILFCERLSQLVDQQDLGASDKPYTLPGLEGRNMRELLQIDEAEFSLKDMREYGERRIRFPDGREMIATVTSRSIEDAHEDFIVFAVHDNTQRSRAEARVRTLAYRDSLTGLRNRIAFNIALETLREQPDSEQQDFAVMTLDLDNFKEVNDQYGHAAGDTLLKTVGRRINSLMKEDDVAARLGGDEFAVLLRNPASANEVSDIANQLLAAIGEPIPMGRRKLNCGSSIGIAMSSQHSRNPARILGFADQALFSAKAAGRSCARFYDAALHKEQNEKRNLERALHSALKHDEFVLHFQPKVCSATREIVGREALIRWNRKDIGIVSPDVFIPLAEQSMLIVDIGRWTINAACRAASRWRDGETVAVNLSARQLLDADLIYHINSALQETGLEPSRLELEITETAIINNTQLATSILYELKSIGIKISLDDFGTGYSSMSYIQEFPFDRIKIDRSFVSSMNVDVKSRAIVESIIHLAHSLEIPVVAEGVETEDQADALASMSCEELQGYLIAAPAPAEGGAEDAVDELLLFESGAA